MIMKTKTLAVKKTLISYIMSTHYLHEAFVLVPEVTTMVVKITRSTAHLFSPLQRPSFPPGMLLSVRLFACR